MLGAVDEAYLASARETRRVIVTQDPDFLAWHQRQELHAGIAYCDQGTRSIGQMIAYLVLMFEVYEPSDMAGKVEFL